MVFNKLLVTSIIIITLAWPLSATMHGKEKNKGVIVLPFENEGSSAIDYLSELIQAGLHSYFKYLPGYTSADPLTVERFFAQYPDTVGQRTDERLLRDLSIYVDMSYIIIGTYNEVNDELGIAFEMIDIQTGKTLVSSEKKGPAGFYMLDTIENIAVEIVKYVTGKTLEFGRLSVVLNDGDDIAGRCFLYIDDKKAALPFKEKLTTGMHQVSIRYDDITIYSEDVIIVHKQELPVVVDPYVPLLVDANYGCDVYLDDERVGSTPYEKQLIAGGEYTLKVVYLNNGIEEVVETRTLNARRNSDITVSVEVPVGEIAFYSGKAVAFNVGLSGKSSYDIPFAYDRLFPGEYTMVASLYDARHKKIPLYKEQLSLAPFEKKIIDLSQVVTHNKKGLCVIPGAGQFYNRRPVKGGIITTLFSLSVLTAAFSPLAAWTYYNYYYLNLVREWNDNLEASGYTREHISTAYKSIDYIFIGMLAGGLGAALFTWVISLVDGLVGIAFINKLLHNDTQPVKKINVRFAIRPVLGE